MPIADVITDVDNLTIASLAAAFVFFLAIGLRYFSLLLILSGIAGLFLAIQLRNLTGSNIVGIIFSAMAIFVMILGLIRPVWGTSGTSVIYFRGR